MTSDGKKIEQFIKDNDYYSPVEVLLIIANGDFKKLKNVPPKTLLKLEENGISPTMRVVASNYAAPFIEQKMPLKRIIENNLSVSDGILKAAQRYEQRLAQYRKPEPITIN